MSNHLDKDIRKYKRTTKRFLVCPRDYRQQFLNDMERDLCQFMEENPSAGYSDIVAYFGTPEELAQTYLDNIPQEELSDFKSKRKFIIYITSIIITALLLGAIVLLFYEFNKPKEIKKVYIYESMEIPEENIEK